MKLISLLLLLTIIFSTTDGVASSYYQNGITLWHDDMGWPDKNKWNYPADDKYHLWACVDCPFVYGFYKYPKSSSAKR